jgi:thiamine-monophosphate kinase
MTTAEDLGERRIIELILQNIDKQPDAPLPFGDDVAAARQGRSRLAILKTDMLIGSLDAPPGMKPYQIARKAAVMNISDFASKGVQPTALLVSLGLPRDYPRESVVQLAKGLNQGCREYGAYLLGGDTSEAPDLIVACMAYGTCLANTLIRRSGAKPGDTLAVTGPFGNTAAGLKVLLEDKQVQPTIRERLLDAVYNPKARLREGLALAKSRAATAGIDSSDGLAVSLHEMRKMCRRGFEVTDLPIAEEARVFAEENRLDPTDLALYGGEEYELIVTIQDGSWDRAVKAVKRAGGQLIKIGEVTADPAIILRTNEKTGEIPYRGWEHFKSRNGPHQPENS